MRKYYICSKCIKSFPMNEVWFQCMHLNPDEESRHHSEAEKIKKDKGVFAKSRTRRAAKKIGFSAKKIEDLEKRSAVQVTAASAPAPQSAAPQANGAASGFTTMGAAPQANGAASGFTAMGAAPQANNAPAVGTAQAGKSTGDGVGQVPTTLTDRVSFCLDKGYFGKRGSGNGIPESAKCPVCKALATDYVCPECYTSRSPNHKKYIINLAGTNTCGKSVFFGALMHQISHNLQDRLDGWTVTLEGKKAMTVKNNFIDSLKSTIQTNSDLSNKGSEEGKEMPAIVCFTKGAKKYEFSFYDIAGEIFNKETSSREDLKSLAKNALQFKYPDFIMMLSNPRQCKGAEKEIRDAGNVDAINFFFSNLERSEAATKQNSIITENIYKVITAVRNQGRQDEEWMDFKHKEGTPYDIPVAVCLTAVDMLAEAYGEEAASKRSYMQRSSFTEKGIFDMEDLERRSSSLVKQYRAWGDKAFLEALYGRFGAVPKPLFGKKPKPQIKFFGTSSLGDYKDKEEYNVENYTPINVLDPFAWILHIIGEEENEKFFLTEEEVRAESFDGDETVIDNENWS